MKRYILFSEDELNDLLNGGETRHIVDEPGEVFFMSEETYAHLLKTGYTYEEEN